MKNRIIKNKVVHMITKINDFVNIQIYFNLSLDSIRKLYDIQ